MTLQSNLAIYVTYSHKKILCMRWFHGSQDCTVEVTKLCFDIDIFGLSIDPYLAVYMLIHKSFCSIMIIHCMHALTHQQVQNLLWFLLLPTVPTTFDMVQYLQLYLICM